MFLVYLAGPITGCSFDECVDWREDFCKSLMPEIIGLSPMRGKSYFEGTKNIDDKEWPEDLNKNSKNFLLKDVLSSDRGIITRDFNDCRRADAIFVNFLGAKRVSIGTVMEIAWAKAFNIPLVVAMEDEGNLHDHSMIKECIGYRVNNLDAAKVVLKALLLPAPHRDGE